MPSLNIERYPTFNENLKKNPKKKNRTFSDVTYGQENTWGYERSTRTGNDLKRMRRANKKLITKSRNTKRQLKNLESGMRTPMEENDASNEADSVDFSIGMEKYENVMMQEMYEMDTTGWYIEVTTSSEGDERPWVSFELKRRCVEPV